MATWAFIFILAAGVCAFTLKTTYNPLKGFITDKLFWVTYPPRPHSDGFGGDSVNHLEVFVFS